MLYRTKRLTKYRQRLASGKDVSVVLAQTTTMHQDQNHLDTTTTTSTRPSRLPRPDAHDDPCTTATTHELHSRPNKAQTTSHSPNSNTTTTMKTRTWLKSLRKNPADPVHRSYPYNQWDHRRQLLHRAVRRCLVKLAWATSTRLVTLVKYPQFHTTIRNFSI